MNMNVITCTDLSDQQHTYDKPEYRNTGPRSTCYTLDDIGLNPDSLENLRHRARKHKRSPCHYYTSDGNGNSLALRDKSTPSHLGRSRYGSSTYNYVGINSDRGQDKQLYPNNNHQESKHDEIPAHASVSPRHLYKNTRQLAARISNPIIDPPSILPSNRSRMMTKDTNSVYSAISHNLRCDDTAVLATTGYCTVMERSSYVPLYNEPSKASYDMNELTLVSHHRVRLQSLSSRKQRYREPESKLDHDQNMACESLAAAIVPVLSQSSMDSLVRDVLNISDVSVSIEKTGTLQPSHPNTIMRRHSEPTVHLHDDGIQGKDRLHLPQQNSGQRPKKRIMRRIARALSRRASDLR